MNRGKMCEECGYTKDSNDHRVTCLHVHYWGPPSKLMASLRAVDKALSVGEYMLLGKGFVVYKRADQNQTLGFFNRKETPINTQ